MKRSDDRILVSHVGSLIRPKPLRTMIAAKLAKQPLDEDAYRQCLTGAVADVVQEQVDIGIDSVSDGEFGKTGWSIYVAERLGGLEPRRISDDEIEELNPFTDTREGERFADFQRAYEPLRLYDWDPATAPDGIKRPATKERPVVWECTGPVT